MKVRPIVWLAPLLLGGCSLVEIPPTHPAATAGVAMTDELRLSFFETFDDRSFGRLAECAFTDQDPEAREQAADLLDDVVWNWHPEFPRRAAQRLRARRLIFPLTRHADARVRAGLWRLARFTYDDPATTTPASDAFAEALADPDPDVRLAALRTAIDLHSGHTGGCVIDRKKTSFTLRTHLEGLSSRVFVEPDPRVRRVLLRALGWCGRDGLLPLFTRYFTEADRRDEVPSLGWTILELFTIPATGLESAGARTLIKTDGAWDRFRAFTESLTETQAARRNGLVLLLHMASESSTTISEDRGLLRRVVDWLERDDEDLREEDLLLIVGHWRVMDPSDVVHQPDAFLRRSSVPELVKSLRELLASDP